MKGVTLPPAALLTICGRNYHGLMVSLGRVKIDGGCSLSAEVSGLGIEIERADAMRTVNAGKLHAALDALDFVGFHCLHCSASA
jgi:hypothetical protein